ncbi:hypothetical protein BJ165DRAFT_1526003 [Panaeolus papilionaceus]|nr:hypothetical protein BJ165DRAFT_1526003 [Panaeolus papilionaceus]
MSSAQPAQTNTKANAPIDENLPPQLHAGKVGYGPNYRAGPTLEEKVAGLKEELLGKVTHNKERVHHGHEIRTGEEKRKKMTGEDEPNPFSGAEEDHSLQSPAAGLKDDKSNDQNSTSSTAQDTTKTPASSSSPHKATASTPGHESASSAARSQSTNVQTSSSMHNGATASDVNQTVPQSGMKQHTGSEMANFDTTASDINQGVPTSRANNNAHSSANTSDPSSTAKKNPINSTSGHLSSNNHSSSIGHSDHGRPMSSDNDSLSRSSYKPSPEKVTFDLTDKKEKERAATVAPKGTEAAEHQRKGGNVTENKYLN